MSLVTLPNCLSLARLVLALPTAWALVHGAAAISVVLFALAVASDLLDGRIARARRQSTPLGTLLDHGADAVFVIVLGTTAAWLGLLPAILPVLMALAFAQYVLDSRAHTGAQMRGSRLGRWNGIAYFVVVGAAVAVHLFLDAALARAALRALGWLLVATTVVSIAARAAHAVRRSSAA